MAGVMSFAMVIALVFIKNKPKFPPNNTSTEIKMQLTDSLKLIFKKKENAFILISFSLFVGVSWSFLTVLDFILEPEGYTTLDIGYLGIIMSTTGTVGGIVATIYLDRQLSKN